MKTTELFMVFLTIIGLSACKETDNSKYMNRDDTTCGDSLSTYSTMYASDSLHSLQIKTYSSFDSSMKRRYPCVIKQELIFKLKDSTIILEQAPIKEQVFDSSSQCPFLKYVINGIAVDSIKSQKIYMLYLYAANGEAEYNYFYNQRGKVLFSQRCDKKGCDILCYDFDEETAVSYSSDDSRILSIKEVKGICH